MAAHAAPSGGALFIFVTIIPTKNNMPHFEKRIKRQADQGDDPKVADH
jgi:hypothetical protein